MRYRKSTLCVIIVLLVFFLPITIFSTTKAIQKALYVENPNHEFKYNNKLYFYDGEELLGTYPCLNFTEVCELATPDNKPDPNIILKEYEVSNPTTIPIINSRYVFVKDTTFENVATSSAILYDLTTNQLLIKYNKVKNYGIGLDNNILIVQDNNGKYGVIELADNVIARIPYEYDYIGASSIINPETNKISSTKLVTLKDNIWQIVDSYGSVLSTNFENDIYTYNDTYIVLKQKDNQMYLTNYSGDVILTDTFKYLDFYEQYLLVIDNSNNFYIYNLQISQRITNTYPVNDILIDNRVVEIIKTEG